MLGNANGQAEAMMKQGSISKLLLEEMGLNLGNVVLTKLLGDSQIKINCVNGDFVVTKGMMQPHNFVVDTDTSRTDVTGNINLATEKMDLTINPHSKGIRVLTLHTPIYVHGTFREPQINLDKGVLAMKAGGAAALGILAAPAALLVPLTTLRSPPSGCPETGATAGNS
jgi:uncharacterized protein involved in outer membrane biogenesis